MSKYENSAYNNNYEISGKEYWPKIGLPRLKWGARFAAIVMAVGLSLHVGQLVNDGINLNSQQATMQGSLNGKLIDSERNDADKQIGDIVGFAGSIALLVFLGEGAGALQRRIQSTPSSELQQ